MRDVKDLSKGGDVLCIWIESWSVNTVPPEGVMVDQRRGHWQLQLEHLGPLRDRGPELHRGQDHSSALRAFAERLSSKRCRRRVAADSPQMRAWAQPSGDREGLGEPTEEE